MGLNSPVPVRLNEECRKAAKILSSFIDGSTNSGLDRVIPRDVLEHAKGFAIFTVVKAGFLLSARGGSGIVVAKLDDGSWSAPSAIGTAGIGFGSQLGAEITDFLIVLNSRSAVTTFMSAGSLNLGGNMSLAVGPLGRNAEGMGSINTSGKAAAMYSYSKTKGLFGGVSIEGSVIVERQDANRLAYGSSVTVKQLLSGSVDPPPFADALINKLISCTERLPSGRQWIPDDRDHSGSGRSSPAPDVNEFGAPSSPYGGSGGGEDFSQQPPAQYGFVGMGSTCGKDKDGRSRSGSGGRLGMGGRTRSGSILSEGNLGMGPRTRSGSILGNGNGRKRGDSVSKVVEQDVTGGSGGRGGSPKPSSSPKPGLFSNVSFTGRKRGNSYSKGGADASGHYSTSEGYNADAPVKPIHPRAQAYLAEVFPLQPEGAPTLSSSPSNSNSVTPFSTVPTPPPSTRRVSSVATPTFATHFESDFAHDESDLLSSSPPQADPDLIAWDDSRQKTRPRGNSSPLNPSSFDEDRNRDYRNPNSSSRYDDELYPSSESMAIPRPAFSSSASSGSGSFSRFMSSSPSNSNSATNGKKKSRPFSAFVRSGSFVNTPSSPNHSPSTPTGGYGNDDYFGSRPSPPPPSHREDLKAEEDWGALGTKARIGLGRTRSGSGSQLLNSTTASDLLHDVPDEDGQVEGTGGGWGNESREDEVHSRMEKMRIVPKKGLDLDKAELKRMGFVGRGIALFDFKTEQEGDLNFSRGDVLFLLEKTDENWWMGQVGLEGLKGIFPTSYVELDFV